MEFSLSAIGLNFVTMSHSIKAYKLCTECDAIFMDKCVCLFVCFSSISNSISKVRMKSDDQLNELTLAPLNF